MTFVSPTRFVAVVNERIERGTSVAVLGFECASTVDTGLRGVQTYVGARLRNGDVVCNPSNGIFTVACTGSPRGRQDDSDAAFAGATHRIGAVLREVAGQPFAGTWQRIGRRTSRASLLHALEAQLTAQLERRRALAHVAHELRSPLSSIGGYLELMQSPGATADYPAFARTARAEALRMGRMLDGMVEFSLLAGGAERTNGVCQPSAAVDRAVEAIRPHAVQRHVELRVGARTHRSARVAFDDCIRATSKLLENAIAAGARTIVVATTFRHGLARITVDDDGPGVPAKEREQIFARGYRGSAGARYSGSGFGLASVRAIAQSRGGSACVARSRLGGARFTLRFVGA